MNKFSSILKKLFAITFFFLMIVVAWEIRQLGYFDEAAVFSRIERFSTFGPLLFIGIYVGASLLFIPTMPLNIGAGVLWGGLLGGVYSVAGSVLGAFLAFLISRTAFGKALTSKFDNKILLWLNKEMSGKPWKVVAFTRLNPIFPTALLNYLFGLTSISVTTYTWATLVFIAPPTILISFLGKEIRSFVFNETKTGLSDLILIVLGIIALLFILRSMAKVFLNHKQRNA